MNYYKSLYLYLYQFCKKYLGKEDIPEFKAVSILTIVETFWFMSIFIMLGFFSSKDIDLEDLPIENLIVLSIAFLAINYFSFIHQKKYVLIENTLEQNFSKISKAMNLLFLVSPFVIIALFTFLSI